MNNTFKPDNALSYVDAMICAVRDLLKVIDAHEIDTIDCDRRGDVHCDCLTRAKAKVEGAIAQLKEHI
jgi:hypothetical protein